MYCICCKKNNVKPHAHKDDSGNHLTEEEILWKKELKRDNAQSLNHLKVTTVGNFQINSGVIQVLDAGFGSSHDGDQFLLAICDKCIRKNLEEGVLLYWGNYMGFNDIEEKNIKESKLKYRRMSNIDKLI